MPNIMCVIPVFNESKFITDVIKKVSPYVNRVIVADDNSTDDTVKVAKEAGAIVISNLRGRGVGRNTRLGIELALEKNADIIITIDGDGQHNPDDIPKFIKPILEDNADIVIGSRFSNYRKIPLYRRFGISVITYCFNIFSKVRIGDSQCGFRAYSKRILQIMPIEERGFEFIIETLVKSRAWGFNIAEVPIQCLYHADFKDNHTNSPITHGLGTLFSLIKWRLKLDVIEKLK